MLSFGDLFYIKNKEYVYLFADGENLYGAIILDTETTNQVKLAEQKRDRKGESHKMPIYCYVELSTEDYTGCSANMIGTQKEISFDSSPIRSSNKKLNEDDLREIRNEIVESETLFKPSLVNYMKSVFAD